MCYQTHFPSFLYIYAEFRHEAKTPIIAGSVCAIVLVILWSVTLKGELFSFHKADYARIGLSH